MSTDVKTSVHTSDETVVTGRTRVRGVIYTNTAVAGSITLTDDGAGGTAHITIATPAVAAGDSIMFPGNGVLFENDVYIALVNVTSATVIYG